MKLLGCLIKAPLGCLSFFIGASVVFVVFLPPACGSRFSKEGESWFEVHHEGELELDKVWVGSLYGEQKLEGVKLRDPEGREIFDATILAPSFEDLLAPSGNSWGPVFIQIPELSLVAYADGTTNLSRALAHREHEGVEHAEFPIAYDEGTVQLGQMLSFPLSTIDMRIAIERLTWTAPTREELVLENVECDGQLRVGDDGELVVELSGRAVFEGGDPDGLVLNIDLQHLERFPEPESFLPWSARLELRDAPVLALEAMVGRAGQFRRPLGATVTRCVMVVNAQSAEVSRVQSFELVSEEARIALAGDWRRREDLLVASASDDSIFVEFPASSWWTRDVAGRILPLMDELELESTVGYAAIGLEEYVIPLRGQIPKTSGVCTVYADSASYLLPAAIAGELLYERKGTQPAPFRIELSGGLANYAEFKLGTEKGELGVRGELDLTKDEYDLTLTTKEGEEYRVVGPRTKPELVKSD